MSADLLNSRGMETVKEMRLYVDAKTTRGRVERVSLNVMGESRAIADVCADIAALKADTLAGSARDNVEYRALLGRMTLLRKEIAKEEAKILANDLEVQTLNRAAFRAVWASINGADSLVLADGVNLFDSLPVCDTTTRLASLYTNRAKTYNESVKVTKTKKVSAEEKAARIAALRAQLAELETL